MAVKGLKRPRRSARRCAEVREEDERPVETRRRPGSARAGRPSQERDNSQRSAVDGKYDDDDEEDDGEDDADDLLKIAEDLPFLLFFFPLLLSL